MLGSQLRVRERNVGRAAKGGVEPATRTDNQRGKALEPAGGRVRRDGAAKRALRPALAVLSGASMGIALVVIGHAPLQRPVASFALLAVVVTFTTSIAFLHVTEDAPQATPRDDGQPHRAPWALQQLAAEIERSRRYERPFSILRLSPARTNAGPPRTRAGEPLPSPQVERLEQRLRTTDRWWQQGDSLYLLLPECDRKHAEGLAQRLLADLDDLPREASMASFPVDGLTTGALWDALRASTNASVRS